MTRDDTKKDLRAGGRRTPLAGSKKPGLKGTEAVRPGDLQAGGCGERMYYS